MKLAVKGMIPVAVVIGLVFYGMNTMQTLDKVGQKIGKQQCY